MDSTAGSWNLEVKSTHSSSPSTHITECGGSGAAAARVLASASSTRSNERDQISCALSAECTQSSTSKTQHGQQEPKMLRAAGYQASQNSVGTPCDEPGRSSCASRSSIKEGRPDDYVKALQEAGRYDLWAPLLHEARFLEAPSLLLGQIRFDVTSDDQRGSWLLPEELLTQQTRPVSEDGEDRQLFTNTPITEEEQQAIDQVLLQLLEAQEQEDAENTAQQRPDALLGIQPVWLEQLVLRYLYSCSFERQKTFDLLQSTLTFRTQQLPVLESEVYHELRNMGACYWHGRDHMMRPLLVVSLQRLQQLQREAAVEEKVTRLVVFCLEFFLRYLCVAGVVENWCILCDLNGTSISSFPLPLLLRLMQLIQGSYRGRLYRFYILHAPRLFHFIAKPLVSSLPTTTAKKLRVFTNADEWDQERRAQFAAHQLEKKYGGTAPDITEHWYPFRFFPGPFEPEGEAGQRGDRNAAVRWESEQALHAKVHPLVHTGASLHTSLIWSRRAERRSAPLRYAAWLRHLPDLHLAPATVDWARGLLSNRLQGCHDSLAQQIMDQGGLSEVSKAPDSSIETSNGTSGAPNTVTVSFSLSSSSCECGTSLPLIIPSEDGSACSTPASSDLLIPHVVPLVPELGQLGADPHPRQHRLRIPPLSSSGVSLTDDTSCTRTVKAAQDFKRNGGGSVPYGANDADGRCWESPLGQARAFTSRLQVPSPVRSAQGCSEETGQGTYEAPPAPSPFFNAGKRVPLLTGTPPREERPPEDSSQQTTSPRAPQPARNKRSPPYSPSAEMQGTTGRASPLAHARTSWALDGSSVQPDAHTEGKSVFRNNNTVTQSHESSPKSSCPRDRRRVFAAAGERWDGNTVEKVEASACPLACSSSMRTPGQQELNSGRAISQPTTPPPLQHPYSPASLGGTCRTVSLSASDPLERTGPPANTAWQNAPSCERSPKWSISASRSLPSFPCDAVMGSSKAERPSSLLRPSTTQVAVHCSHTVGAASKTADSKESMKHHADGGLHYTKFPRAVSQIVTRRMRVQGSSHFLSPVAAEPSPSVSVYSFTGSIRSETCLVCENLSDFQGGVTSRMDEVGNQLQVLGVQMRKERGTPAYCSTPPAHPSSHAEIAEEQPGAAEGVLIEPQASRVMELRRLKRVMRALYSSVSGTYRRSDNKQHLDHYDATPEATRRRRLCRRHARSKLQKTEKIHQQDRVEPENRHRIGLRRRLSRRLLPQNCHTAATPGAGGVPKPAGKRRYHRRVSLYRRGTGAIAGARFSLHGSTLRSNESDCEAYVKTTSRARIPLSFSAARGTSKRLIRLPLSFSDRVRRGTLVLARSMQGRARRSGTI